MEDRTLELETKRQHINEHFGDTLCIENFLGLVPIETMLSNRCQAYDSRGHATSHW
jgi:hypothetical protein